VNTENEGASIINVDGNDDDDDDDVDDLDYIILGLFFCLPFCFVLKLL